MTCVRAGVAYAWSLALTSSEKSFSTPHLSEDLSQLRCHLSVESELTMATSPQEGARCNINSKGDVELWAVTSKARALSGTAVTATNNDANPNRLSMGGRHGGVKVENKPSPDPP